MGEQRSRVVKENERCPEEAATVPHAIARGDVFWSPVRPEGRMLSALSMTLWWWLGPPRLAYCGRCGGDDRIPRG